MMYLDKLFLEKTIEQINDYKEQQEESYALSSKSKPINERAKGLNNKELESMINNIKILLETINTNNIMSKVENRLDINDKEPEEEAKKFNIFLYSTFLHLISLNLIIINQ